MENKDTKLKVNELKDDTLDAVSGGAMDPTEMGLDYMYLPCSKCGARIMIKKEDLPKYLDGGAYVCGICKLNLDLFKLKP